VNATAQFDLLGRLRILGALPILRRGLAHLQLI